MSEKKWLSRDKSKWFACQHGGCIADFPECITEGDDMEDAYRMDKA